MKKYIKVYSKEQCDMVHDKLGICQHSNSSYTYPVLIAGDNGGWTTFPDRLCKAWPIIDFAEFMGNLTGYKLIKTYPGSYKLGTILSQPTAHKEDFWDPEFWEPVYEEKKIIKVPHSEGVMDVVIDGSYARYDDYAFNKAFFDDIMLHKGMSGLTVTATEFTIGCKKGIKRSSLEEIYKALS